MLLLLSRFSRVRLCATPRTAAYQASPPMGFSRQEYWSGVPLPSLNNNATSSQRDESTELELHLCISHVSLHRLSYENLHHPCYSMGSQEIHYIYIERSSPMCCTFIIAEVILNLKIRNNFHFHIL